MNTKNDNAKKDLCLAYSQGNITAYPPIIEAMARYLSTQFPNKNSAHQHKGKKGDRNRKKGEAPKSEKKDNNTTGTADEHVGDTITSKDFTASSGETSIGAHVLEATEHLSRQTHSVYEILRAHPMSDDDFGVGLTQVTCLLTQQTAKK